MSQRRLTLIAVSLAAAAAAGGSAAVVWRAPAAHAQDPGTPPGVRLTRPGSLGPAADPTDPASRFTLEATPDGGYRYQGNRLTAQIAPDGSVAFSPPRWLVTGPEATQLPEEPPLTRPTVYDDPTRTPDNDPPRAPVVQPIIVAAGARFDVTDEYRRMMGDDRPDRDIKAAFLAATFDLRTRMAVAHRSRARMAQLDALPGEMAAIWTDPARSRREKVQILTLMRADMNGGGPDATSAVTIFDDFVRRNLTPAEAASTGGAGPP